MKKYLISLILLLPFIVTAQNDSLVDVTLQRMYGEITDRTMYSLNSLIIGDCSSDNSEVGGENSTDVPEYQEQMLFQSKPCNIALVTELWNRAYDVVLLSNYTLAMVQQTSYSSTEKNKIIAEAKFLRSLMYFELARNFGGVPLYTDTIGISYNVDPYTSYSFTTNWGKSRSSISEVFQQIENDLSECISALPERSELNADNKLKATKGAARALLAKIYLYQSSYAKYYPSDPRFAGLMQQWGNVLFYAEEVINSGQYKLIGIDGEKYSTYWDNTYLYSGKTSGFRYIFSVSGNNSAESVFECNEFIEGWSYIMNNSSTNWTSCRYIYENGSLNASGGWGFVKPTTSLIDEFAKESGKAKDDPRFIVSVGQIGDSIQVAGNTWKAMSFNETLPQTACRKYECSASEFWDVRTSWGDSPLGFKIIRYSDVLLMAAEAALMDGSTTKALQYINMVRTRARMCGTTGFPKNLTAVTMDDIIHERRIELALEGHRFYDLVRWGQAEKKLNGRMNASFQQNVVFAKGENEFLPIPDEILRKSEGLVAQNPGYKQVCAYINGLSDMYITSSQTKSVVDIDFSSTTLSNPVTKVYTSNSAKAKATLEGKKLQIAYLGLKNGDSITICFSVFPETSTDSIFTTFKISVIDPVKVFTTDEINTVKSGFSDYRLEMKNDLTSIIPAASYKTSVYLENGTNVQGFSATYRTITKLNRPVLSLNLMPSYLKTNYLAGIIPSRFNALVILKTTDKPTIAVQIPVDLLKLFPTISVKNKDVAQDEVFTIPVSTTYIDTTSFSITQQIYLPKIDDFNMYISYDPSYMSFIKSDYQSTLFNAIKSDSVSDNNDSGSLFVKCTSNQPILGEGTIVNLQFKALKTSTTDLKITYFYYGSNYNPNVFFDSELAAMEVPKIKSNSNILVYPNPVNSQLRISSAIDLSGYSIFDLNGRNILNGSLNGTIGEIETNLLNPGIYFIRLKGQNVSEMKKFIKQ